MSQDNFTITGQVIDRRTNQGIPGLTIEIWDKDHFLDDYIGRAQTDTNGSFEIHFNEALFKEQNEQLPALYFRIILDNKTISSESCEITVSPPHGKPLTGKGDKVFRKLEPGNTHVLINLALSAIIQNFRVQGTILNEDGAPAAGIMIRAFDRDLRIEELLGEAVTDHDGQYEITYTAEQFWRAEKKSADLLIRALDHDKRELGVSSIHFNAPKIAVIDLTIQSQLSEFERLLDAISPLLKIDNVTLADLNDEDVTFLTGETGFKKERLQILADAARITDEAELNLDLAGNDVIALFYGLGRKGRPLVLNDLLSQDFYILRRMLESALDENIIPSYLSDELDAFFAELNRLVLEAGIEKPVSHIAVQQAHLQQLGEFIGLDSAKISTLINRVVSFSGISDTTLGALVEEGGLEEQEAKEVGLIVSLYQLCDKNEALTQEMKTGDFPQLPEGNVNRIKDLVIFSRSDWLDILTQAEITPPDDLTMEVYATVLCKKIEKLYPGDTLLARLIRAEDTENLTDSIKKSTHYLEKLAGTYNGLKLDEIIGDSELSADEKAVQINERVGLLSRFQSQNSDAEVLTLDYTAQSEEVAALDFSGFSAEEQRMVLSCFKAYQRVYTLSEDIETCRTLMSAGYDSASRIADDSEENLHTRSGLSADISHDIYTASIETAGASATLVGSLTDVAQGGYGWIDSSNQCEEIDDYLKQIEGFAELFGSLDYCQCEHCQSILSPAAYFVDLLSFVETYILDPNFPDDLQDHVLNLKTRRKDLWQLPLTCENTHGLTPYLDIINEVLENYIYISEHDPEDDELPDDRSDIERFVFQERIYRSINSLQLPRLLPLIKLETYLSHFEVSRGEVAKLLEKDSTVVAPAVLNLSRKECNLITEPNESLDFHINLYGIHFTIDSDSGHIDSFDAQELLSPMGLSRSELGQLISTEYVQPGSEKTIRIQGEKRDINESVQEDIERIYGLTLTALDRMHRFTRLWRQLPWSLSELDLVLSHLKEEELSFDIDDPALDHLVTLLTLQERFSVSVEELCALWSSIPQVPVAGQDRSLFDRLFNLPQFVSHDGSYPKSSTFTHPAFGQEGEGQSRDLHRLLAGLRVDDEQLFQLIYHLRGPLGLNVDIPPEDPAHKPDFRLTIEHLSLLYRHARLMQHFYVTVPQLFQLIGQQQSVGSGFIGSLGALSLFLKYCDWWKSSNYSVNDVSFILAREPADSDSYPDARELARQTVNEIHNDGALTFADTIFAYLDNVTEEQSKIIIDTNSGWIIPVPDTGQYRLSSRFDPKTMEHDPRAGLTFSRSIFAYLEGITNDQSEDIITANSEQIEKIEIPNPYGRPIRAARLSAHFEPDTLLEKIPEGIALEAQRLLLAYYTVEEGIYSLLMPYHPMEILPLYLARHLDSEVNKTKSLIEMAIADPALSWQVLFSALNEVEPPDADAPLTNLVEKLQRLSLLFKGKSFDAPALESIREHGRDIFSIDDFTDPGIIGIQKISLYEEFLSGIAEPASMDDLIHVLVHFSDDPFSDHQTLARLLHTETGLITAITAQLPLTSSSLDNLDKVRSCVDLARRLGVGGDALGLIVSENYDELDQAQNAVFAALRAKYDNEEEWNEKIVPYEDKINTFKRDVLSDYLVHSPEHTWCTSDSDLYSHFLLDVELEGCARTSRVVAAISSIQLYIHRVLMNLEQSENGDIRVTPNRPEDFVTEWEWRKNYRVWEANRKVFLYPENWIEPELRDNKTPLFEDLESELLQQEINEQTILDAYARYMGGFEELAHLKIAGSFHEKDEKNKADQLHLFGVTADEPPIYYYRVIENSYYGETEPNRGIVWHPWRKVDVQIPVSKVSPVVFRGRLHVFWVEITTRPKNDVKGGNSQFVGYQHKMSLKYTKLRLDGTWTTPQRISLYGVAPFDKGDGIIEDPLIDQDDYLSAIQKLPNWVEYVNTLNNLSKIPKYDDQKHTEPKDGYTLTGYRWDRVYPAVFNDDNGVEQLVITGRDWKLIAAPIDFYERSIKQGQDGLCIIYDPTYLKTHQFLYSDIESEQRKLYYFYVSGHFQVDYARASVFTDKDRILSSPDLASYFDAFIGNVTEIGNTQKQSQLSVINGSLQNVIINIEKDLLYLARKPLGGHFWLKRLGTTLSENVARTLLAQGVERFLNIDTQKNLVENPSPINKNGEFIDDNYITKAIASGHPDFKGAFGTYYREIFFHIPFLIANHLNSQQQFREAQKWYHYIFNPTAGKEENVFGTDYTPTPEDQKCKEKDNAWRYIEFRNLTIEKLRELLTDSATIATYKKNPFNPHAIARLRLTAYQKTIVMKYIDNLLDWGDDLFVQDTMESINEATLLYVLASDILGKRPAELGECSEIPESSRTYESIKEVMDTGSEFLIEMESYPVFEGRLNYASPAGSIRYTLDPATIMHATEDAYASIATASYAENDAATVKSSTHARVSASKQRNSAAKFSSDVGLSMQMDWNQANMLEARYNPREWVKFVKHIPVFCIPENRELKQYWDRVEDRLYKIRNCMNISGVRRELSLFAPEIDPGLLVRARAAGLSVEDVLNAISGNLPPYRFSYVIDKAKSYAATLQGFGSALLSALEKKDVEELTLLRAVHEQNIMKMTTQVKKWEINAANENIESLNRRKETVEHRRDYYESLINDGRTKWEVVHSLSIHLASSFSFAAEILDQSAGILYLLPQLGSPFAMKYGGKEVGASAELFSKALKDSARHAGYVGASASHEANLQRREQNWEFQLDQAEQELKELDRQIKAAEIHKDLAARSLEIHEKSLDQLDEVYEFYGDKFSSLGLYTWLSTTLQRLYRVAYNSAFSMAKLAEQTYRFERSDDTGELLGSGHWEASRAGLLAGERLMIDLQNLERKYIETNYRDLEINQTFSLAQIAPDALVTLKETGTCEFNIAELFFDLFYPGHYRRRIKAVRMTIPCVTGPYTNVSATLTLTDSNIRVEPTTDDDALKPVPRTRTLSIATSSAQNDAGVFELNFRDERYMPFEGAGAISSWKLALPASFRQFDYDTISDLLIHISYTAEKDGALRDTIEAINTDVEGSLLKILRNNPLQRTLSLRHDFSSEFHRLLHGTPGNPVTISMTTSHLPFFLRGKKLQLDGAKLILKTPEGQGLGQFSINIDNSSYAAENFSVDTDYGGLPTCEIQSALVTIFGEHSIEIENAGAMSSDSGIDSEKLEDILLCITYTVSSDSG